MFTENHRARAEIMRIAEPEDPFVNLLVEIAGPPRAANILTGRENLTAFLGAHTEEAYLHQRISPEELKGIGEALGQRIQRWSNRVGKVSLEQEAKMVASYDAWLCIPEDDDWPTGLNDLGDKKPTGLWGRGDRKKLADVKLEKAVAVVGSRDNTSYGTSATSHLVGALAERGYVTVSGGAFGIDAVAHRTALATSSARLPTVALMACGVDRPYPIQQKGLLQEIMEQGLILSEVPLGFSPTRWRFLQRNRLIAALSAYSVVVEARWRSGALNTAHHALSLGREVGVVPGMIFSPNSEGCHRLLRKNLAQVVTDASDIYQHIEERFSPVEPTLDFPSGTDQNLPDDLTENQQRIWDALPLRRGISSENLALMSGVDSRRTMLALSQLSQRGYAENTGGGWTKSKSSRR